MKNNFLLLQTRINSSTFLKKLSIIFLLGIAIFMHCYKLGSLPYGIHFDELGMGYDAWCLANFGVDRHMMSFPVYLQNYGGGQSSLYCYVASIFIKFFGFSIITIRLPAVLFSFLFLFFGYKIINLRYHNWNLNFLFLVFYTILPYFTMQSRIGLDCNLMLSVSTIFLYYYLKAIDLQSLKYFFLSGFFAGITLYTYALSYIVLPIFLLLSISYLLYLKRFSVKHLLSFTTPLALLAAPLILVQLINIFNLQQMVIAGITFVKLPEYRGAEFEITNILSNAILSIKSILFFDWIPYNTSHEYLTMYWVSLPFIGIGAWITLSKTFKSIKQKVFSIDAILFLWFISIFLMGCFLGGTGPNSNKLNGIFFALLYFLISGIKWAFSKKYKFKKLLVTTTCSLYVIFFLSFTHSYFTQEDQMIWFFDHEFSGPLEYLEENLDEDEKDNVVYINSSEIYFLASSLISPYDAHKHSSESGYKQFKFGLPESPSDIDHEASYLILEKNLEYVQDLIDLGFEHTKVDNYFVCIKK